MKDNNNWGIKNKLEEFNLINEPNCKKKETNNERCGRIEVSSIAFQSHNPL